MTGIVWCYYGIFIQSMQEDWTIRVAAVHVRQIVLPHVLSVSYCSSWIIEVYWFFLDKQYYNVAIHKSAIKLKQLKK